MRVYNVHERRVNAQPDTVGDFIDSLSGSDDRLWPRGKWPPMRLDSPLGEGARGGHGPVRYRVSEYIPGRRVVFQFEDSGLTSGLDGRHFFEVVPRRRFVLLRHIVDAECDMRNWLKWGLFTGPMHDALLEDALDRLETGIGGLSGKPRRWSLWVRFLRWMVARKARG